MWKVIGRLVCKNCCTLQWRVKLFTANGLKFSKFRTKQFGVLYLLQLMNPFVIIHLTRHFFFQVIRPIKVRYFFRLQFSHTRFVNPAVLCAKGLKSTYYFVFRHRTYIWLYFAFCFLIPCFCIMVCYTALILNLRKVL